MEMNRKALYNTLRMNWINEPTTEIEPWQVEDYRSMPIDELFERLENREIRLDKSSFVAFADTMDSPEDMADTVVGEDIDDVKLYDQVYLVIFELWRRLLPEKPSLSIFCDELDHQIYLFDRNETQKLEDIEDALANLQVILDENTDEGADPHEAFNCVSQFCANDIETFLHDFISDQIDNDNTAYAGELLDGFESYIQEHRWFEFLRARIAATTDPTEAINIVKRLIGDKKAEPDIEFNFEALNFLITYGDRETFEFLVIKTAELIEVEEDFQSLLSICMDFYHRLDREAIERPLQAILQAREKNDLAKPFNAKDPHFLELLKILSAS